MTLDGGAGNDTLPDRPDLRHPARRRRARRRRLLPADTFPSLVPTTRGWLSPGTHAPLLATGGTGNDTFTVYSNQAEIQLNGDDDNDLFIVRAFAIAAVCDTDADGDRRLRPRRRRTRGARRPASSRRTATDGPASATCADSPDGYTGFGRTTTTTTSATTPTRTSPSTTRRARTSTSTTRCGRTTSSRSTRTASPCPSSASASRPRARSTSAPAAARTRCSTTSTPRSTSTAAPASTSSSSSAPSSPTTSRSPTRAIYGAGLNVKYTTVEVLEIDGLEGDDQFFVLSTAYGVAYRVIGGLGSDRITVAGDVTADIVTRELEGLSGAVDHIVTARRPALRRPADRRRALQPRHRPTRASSSSRSRHRRTRGARGRARTGPIRSIDSLHGRARVTPRPRTSTSPSRPRVAVSRRRTTRCTTRAPLADGIGDTVWLCVGTGRQRSATSSADFQRHYVVNGVVVDEDGRAVVLTFTPRRTGTTPQRVYLWAVDDPRAEGDRMRRHPALA